MNIETDTTQVKIHTPLISGGKYTQIANNLNQYILHLPSKEIPLLLTQIFDLKVKVAGQDRECGLLEICNLKVQELTTIEISIEAQKQKAAIYEKLISLSPPTDDLDRALPQYIPNTNSEEERAKILGNNASLSFYIGGNVLNGNFKPVELARLESIFQDGFNIDKNFANALEDIQKKISQLVTTRIMQHIPLMRILKIPPLVLKSSQNIML